MPLDNGVLPFRHHETPFGTRRLRAEAQDELSVARLIRVSPEKAPRGIPAVPGAILGTIEVIAILAPPRPSVR